eukprot:4683550-Ditylum_brightwellii.AAC.1
MRKENEHGQEIEGKDDGDEMDSKNEEELPQEMADEERDVQMLASEKLILDAAKHVEMAQEQQNYVNAKKAEAVATKDNLNHNHPRETYYYSPVNAYTFGIVDNSKVPTTLSVYCYLEDEGNKGGNDVASMMWQKLKRKGLVPEYDASINIPETHEPAEEINLVFDNCGGQNKNRMLLSVNVYTPVDLFKVINQQEDFDTIEPEGFFDWDTAEDRYLEVAEQVKKNHIFTVD